MIEACAGPPTRVLTRPSLVVHHHGPHVASGPDGERTVGYAALRLRLAVQLFQALGLLTGLGGVSRAGTRCDPGGRERICGEYLTRRPTDMVRRRAGWIVQCPPKPTVPILRASGKRRRGQSRTSPTYISVGSVGDRRFPVVPGPAAGSPTYVEGGLASIAANRAPDRHQCGCVHPLRLGEEGTQQTRIVFVCWTPDTQVSRERLRYVAKKEEVRNALTGIQLDLQASDSADLHEDTIRYFCITRS
ncbi:hypothetical protein [Streptomyces lateritius]|uniref:hypothetical protein n=1 Tax=Streptomyces lateritius TaxID=67313 RepID=UPI003570A88F